MTLLDNHPYKENIAKAFKTEEILDEYISIDYIDVVHNKIVSILSDFKRFGIKAYIKDVSLIEHGLPVDGISGVPIKFVFENYEYNSDKLNDLEAFAIHDAKNSFLGQYDMTKYANRLYKDHFYDLARHNIEHFKNLAAASPAEDKLRSYRLVEHQREVFVRGITSVNQYNEYGIDFAFVVGMLVFHSIMKENQGDAYGISSVALSASKLELIIADKYLKDAKGFGKVSSSTIISTNDLGSASLKFLNIVKVGIKDSKGFYIYPDPKKDYKNDLMVTHSTKVDNALVLIKGAKGIIRSSDEFIEELEKVKMISKPEELRSRIVFKLENKNSPFKTITSVKDLFSTVIANNIENFAKLLDMCRKAEELDIEYDLKDKLRYIISDIILNKK